VGYTGAASFNGIPGVPVAVDRDGRLGWMLKRWAAAWETGHADSTAW